MRRGPAGRLVVVLLVLTAACASKSPEELRANYDESSVPSSGDDATDPLLEPPTTTEGPDTSASSTTTATTPTTTPLATAPDRGRGSLEEPLPVGSGFTYSEDFNPGTAWDGVVLGLLETGRNQSNDVTGRCLVMLGTLTPTTLDLGVATSGFATPQLNMMVGGTLVDSGVNDCNTDGAEAAGYGWVLDAEVTLGTTYPFHAEFFLPDGTASDPDAVLLGNPNDDSTYYYAPTILDAPPVPAVSVGRPVGESRDLVPVGDPAVSRFTYVEPFGDGDTWDGVVTGLVEADRSDFVDDPGRCYVLLGTLTPTTIAEGEVSDVFTTPPVGLVAGGRLIGSGLECNTDAAEAAGYAWILDAEVAVGTPYPFYAEFFVTGPPVEPEAVVVGNAFGEDGFHYEPTVLPAVPPP